MSKRDDDSIIILAEEMKMQRTQILEALSGLKDVPKKLDRIEECLDRIEADNKAFKAVGKDQGIQINNHEKRIKILEAA